MADPNDVCEEGPVVKPVLGRRTKERLSCLHRPPPRRDRVGERNRLAVPPRFRQPPLPPFELAPTGSTSAGIRRAVRTRCCVRSWPKVPAGLRHSLQVWPLNWPRPVCVALIAVWTGRVLHQLSNNEVSKASHHGERAPAWRPRGTFVTVGKSRLPYTRCNWVSVAFMVVTAPGRMRCAAGEA
jgi:hypothetical protein